jgi:predicted lipoprotein with Yx(FWY)xxD motif
MKRLFIAGVILGAAVVAGVAIAASTGSGSAKSGTFVVFARQVPGAGKVLVDAKGRALYRNEQERNGMVLCNGACASIWKPLLVRGTPKAKGVRGKLAVHRRAGGARQVTYNGKLLYTFALDKPGMVTGNGVKDAFGSRHFTWLVVRPVGTASAPPPPTSSNPPPYPGY